MSNQNLNVRIKNLAKFADKANLELLINSLIATADALRERLEHHEECSDKNEEFGPSEMCECGASYARQATKDLETLVRVMEQFETSGRLITRTINGIEYMIKESDVAEFDKAAKESHGDPILYSLRLSAFAQEITHLGTGKVVRSRFA